MKHLVSLFLIAIIALGSVTMSFAQENQDDKMPELEMSYNSTVCANAGFSLVGALFNAVANSSTTEDFSSTGLPAFQVTYDYQVAGFLSIGVAGSVQFMGYEYYETYANSQDDFVKVDVTRTNIAFRPLFHYGNLDDFDLYSGLRIGYTMWDVSANTEDASTEGFGSGFALQAVAFGMRGYFTDNLGANIELAIGAPHYLSLGVSYRF